jgi:hypothetical protein
MESSLEWIEGSDVRRCGMPSRRSAMAMLAAAAVGSACRAAPSLRRYTPTLDQFAERYVRLTLRLALHQPSLVEAWRGPDGWRPDVREPVAAIRQGIVEAHATIGELQPDAGPDGDRVRYLQSQFAALSIAARRLAGEVMGFFAEASAALALEPEDLVPHQTTMTAVRQQLEQLLPGGGALHECYASFRAANAVAPSRIRSTFRAAIAECRQRVVRQIVLPDTEAIELEGADESGVEARATYDGSFRSRVALNTSGPVDLAHLVWLAAHETYPGHHVQYVLADRDCIRERGWRERELVPNFGRHYLHAEGAAEAGASLLLEGEAFADICRSLATNAGVRPGSASDLVAVHRAVMALDAVIPAVAQQYLDGEIGGEAAADRLTSEALVPDAKPLLAIIERQRTRVLAYPVGRRVVDRHIRRGGSDPWNALARVARTLQLPTL